MKHLVPLCTLIGGLLATADADSVAFHLGRELLQEGNPELSAIEFRRFAMETDEPAEKAAAYLHSSYAYLQAQDGADSGEMLDRAESAGLASVDDHTLLSAETARLMHKTDTALYFYETLSTDAGDPAYQQFARRRAAALHLSGGDIEAARRELHGTPHDAAAAIEALESYAGGSDKSPLVGGLWGLVPGAGYWYSGEIANGFRSLILNSLFLFGMYHTASEDQWGAFAAITFFEVTWYSGSIYGGIDAAQRHNRDRLQTALDGIESGMSYRPDPEVTVPLFKLNIAF